MYLEKKQTNRPGESLSLWIANLLYKKGLTQQAWVAQILHISKNCLSSGLTLGQFLGDELWTLGIFSDKNADVIEP